MASDSHKNQRLAADAPTRASVTHDLFAWATANGSRNLCALEAGSRFDADEQVEILAAAPFARGQLVASLSRTCILGLEPVRDPRLAALRLQDEDCFLVNMLSGRADPLHKHHLYLSCSWPADLVQMLDGSPVGASVQATLLEMDALAARVNQTRPPGDREAAVSRADLLWARGNFRSRRFFENDLGQGIGVMLPGLDLLNHRCPATCKAVWQADGSVEFRAASDVAQAAELSINYGAKSNDELLMGFGFALARNVHEKVTLFLKSPSTDERLGPFFVHRRDHPSEPQIPPALLRCVMSLLYDVDGGSGDEQELGPQEEFVLGENVEPDCVALLQHNLQARLQALKPSQAQDSARLALGQPPSDASLREARLYFISCYRDGQREVLVQALATLAEYAAAPVSATVALLAV